MAGCISGVHAEARDVRLGFARQALLRKARQRRELRALDQPHARRPVVGPGEFCDVKFCAPWQRCLGVRWRANQVPAPAQEQQASAQPSSGHQTSPGARPVKIRQVCAYLYRASFNRSSLEDSSLTEKRRGLSRLAFESPIGSPWSWLAGAYRRRSRWNLRPHQHSTR